MVNIIIFIILLTQMVFLPPKYIKSLKANYYAFFVWIDIIIFSLIVVFVNTSLVSEFDPKCYEQDISCLRCTIGGHIEYSLIICNFIARLFVMLKVLEINIQPFPILAYPKKFIIGIKIFFIILCIAINVALIIQVPMRVQVRENNHSQQICRDAKDDDTVGKRKKIISIFAPMILISHIVLCILFVKKVSILYKLTKNKLFLSPQENVMIEALKTLNHATKPIIKHSILVITMTLTFLFLNALKQTLDPTGVPLYSVDHLIIGLCVVMMFPFGKSFFRIFCGCIERPITKKWMDLLSDSFKEASRSKSIENDKKIKNNAVALEIRETSKIQLSTIHEQVESKTATRFTDPEFSNWSNLAESAENSKKCKSGVLDPHSSTKSDPLDVVMEFL